MNESVQAIFPIKPANFYKQSSLYYYYETLEIQQLQLNNEVLHSYLKYKIIIIGLQDIEAASRCLSHRRKL